MTIHYRYKKINKPSIEKIFINKLGGNSQAIVSAILQKIADEENETIAVDMLSSTNPAVAIGVNVFYPASGIESEQKTIQKIEISENGKDWLLISLIT